MPRATFGAHATVGLLLALAVGLGACGDDGGDGVTDPETASIEVAVTTAGDPTSGVEVELYADGGAVSLESATTGSDGTASFTGLEPGAYDVEIAVPAGYVVEGGADDRQSVTATAGEESVVTFPLAADDTGGDVIEIELTSALTFSPDSVSIAPGTTVRWVNATSMFHTITPDGHSEWTSVDMTTDGQEFEHTFQTAGDYPYYCEPHLSSGMTGIIVVETQ